MYKHDITERDLNSKASYLYLKDAEEQGIELMSPISPKKKGLFEKQ
jgi:hypothetical protein